MSHLVSINLCCYNSEKYLHETLNSIVNQTYKDWELVIINDGSSDLTETIIMEYINRDFPINYHYQDNKGLSYSRNEALKRSKGEFIAFIDHDDIWMPKKLEKQVNILESDREISLIYSNYIKYNMMRMTKKNALKGEQPNQFAFPAILKKYPIGIMTVIIRNSVLKKLDYYFDESLNLLEEYDLFLRIAYKSKIAYINEPLALYRIHENMSSIKHYKRRPGEKAYVINRLLLYHPEIINKYSEELIYANASIARMKAVSNLLEGNTTDSNEIIAQYKYFNMKCFVIYIISLIPNNIYKIINKLINAIIIRRGF